MKHQSEMVNIHEEMKLMCEQKVKEKEVLADVKQQYEKLRITLEQKGYARKRRENAPTTEAMINCNTSSTRYRRK